MSLFTDDVWPLIWCIALACLVLAIASYATGRGRLLYAIGGLAGLAVLLLAIEWLIVSDRERIDAAIDDLADAVQKKQTQDRKSTRLNSSHSRASRMPSSA